MGKWWTNQSNVRRMVLLFLVKIWREEKIYQGWPNTSMPVLPRRTRSLSIPQERHSVFLLPSRSVKNISWFSFAISMIHFGREINTSPDAVSPDPWNDNTTLIDVCQKTLISQCKQAWWKGELGKFTKLFKKDIKYYTTLRNAFDRK
jgi:hypothetical protein